MNKQIGITAVALVFTIVLFEYGNINLLVQNRFYDIDSAKWFVDRDETLWKLYFYSGIKKALVILVLLTVTIGLLLRKSRYVQNYKIGLLIFVLSAIFVPMTIASIKAMTNVPCPKDLKYYGGTYPYVTLLTPYPDSFFQKTKIRCYPAGHASGGFALLSLFFLFKKKRNKVVAITSALVIGWSMGLYKMFIGDHFLGHTVISMILAWLIILIIAKYVNLYFKENVDNA